VRQNALFGQLPKQVRGDDGQVGRESPFSGQNVIQVRGVRGFVHAWRVNDGVVEVAAVKFGLVREEPRGIWRRGTKQELDEQVNFVGIRRVRHVVQFQDHLEVPRERIQALQVCVDGELDRGVGRERVVLRRNEKRHFREVQLGLADLPVREELSASW